MPSSTRAAISPGLDFGAMRPDWSGDCDRRRRLLTNHRRRCPIETFSSSARE
jgi:hypothetical protein